MRLLRLFLTAIVLALGSGRALAAPAPADGTTNIVAAPQWREGSTWEYSDGYGLRVASTGPGATVFERLDAPGQWFSMRGFLRQDAASATVKRQTIFRSVPPNAGDGLSASEPLTFQREYLSNKQLTVHATSWTVEGHQTITVPAGTFDCWVIVWRARSLKGNWTGFERWWYSPAAQLYVRIEYKYGAMATASRVLMHYSLGQTPAPSMRPAAAEPVPGSKAGEDAASAAPVSSARAITPVGLAVEPLAPPVPLQLTKMDMAEPETKAPTPAKGRAVSPIPAIVAGFLAKITKIDD